MNPAAAADLVLLHVLAPALEERAGGSRSEPGSGLGLKPFSGSRRSLQDAACKLQPFGFPATKGSRPQLMVFRNLVRPEDGGPGPGSANSSAGARRLTINCCPRDEARSPPGSPRAGGGGCCCPRRQERVCFDLARDFGDFSVAPPEWKCSESAEGGAVPGDGDSSSSRGARSPNEEPTDTSDAVLVLEGIEPGMEPQLEAAEESGCPGADSPAAAAAACPRLAEPESPGGLPKVRLSRCSSSPSPSLQRDGDEKLLSRLPVKNRRSSLKIRLGKLFRAKSCNGNSDPAAKRHSVELDTSAGCLVEISQLQEGYTIRSKPRLTRTQSAFTPVSLASPFAGETVSLVDLDISRRGPPSPHPPTPPPPPRRSLSLLDTLQRNSPQIRPMTVQPQHCMFNRRDSNTFAASLRELEKCGWYWGPMNWDDAEMKLKGKPDGSFLVRDSSDPRYILSLSFRSQGITHHTRMEHYRGTFSLWCHPKFEDRCQSVVEFIERAIMHSKNGKFLYFLRSRVPGLPPTPVQLLYPVSRFSNVKSLQHLCRFRIRQLVRIDHIPELPLPKPLISYLRKFYYYDPEEEAYLSLREARLCITHEQDMDTQT
ncbi:suppressor of cytokine signaling 7 isoform X2 [Stegostoma tigrinum]|uniref:suppressor of cytokine signaling 7 isoform X2 n=1 Tax=Stegostoma tigrinum TaxID=3053191 RepID=UPI00202AEFEB|nr:suppressor of cytokine signaling 7 isoform X2 [Stegostoma tigrinum]